MISSNQILQLNVNPSTGLSTVTINHQAPTQVISPTYIQTIIGSAGPFQLKFLTALVKLNVEECMIELQMASHLLHHPWVLFWSERSSICILTMSQDGSNCQLHQMYTTMQIYFVPSRDVPTSILTRLKFQMMSRKSFFLPIGCFCFKLLKYHLAK